MRESSVLVQNRPKARWKQAKQGSGKRRREAIKPLDVRMDVEIAKAVGYWSGQAEMQHVGHFGVMMCCQSWG